MYRIYSLIIMHFVCVYSCADYYWRDYDGRIPVDAVPAGKQNNSNCPCYIGQAYVHNYGLLLGTIIPGSMEIQIPCYGVVKTNIMIKILCASTTSNFHWLPSTASTFKRDTEGEFPILGGYDRKNWENTGSSGILNIGRIRQHGRTIIGNIAAYNDVDVWFYYPLHGKEIRATSYEVLVYRDDPLALKTIPGAE